MFLKGVSKRTSGSFKPNDSNDEVQYDFIKLHVICQFGIDDDVPELDAGDPVDVIKVKPAIWEKFLAVNGLANKDVIGMSIKLNYNKYGKVSGISVVQ